MTEDQVRDFKVGVSMAAWNMDLWRFAEVIGDDAEHPYTQEKFQQLNALGKALNRFDAETLAKIINAASPTGDGI